MPSTGSQNAQLTQNVMTDDPHTYFAARFRDQVSAYGCLDSPLGRFWGLTYWDDNDQLETTMSGFKPQFKVLWHMAEQRLQEDAQFRIHLLWRSRAQS